MRREALQPSRLLGAGGRGSRGHLVQGIAPHYAAVPINHPLMYWGSSGLLEIAINYGSAARKWQARINEWFELEW